MRKKYTILFLLLVFSLNSIGQELSISNIEFNKLLNHFEQDSRNESNTYVNLTKAAQIALENNKSKLRYNLKSKLRYNLKTIELNDNEKVIFLNNKSIITKTFNEEKSENYITKYDISRNKRKIKQTPFPVESEIKFINQEGNFISVTYGEGEAFLYEFFDNNFNLINSYKPYKYGFMLTSFDFHKEKIVIASQEKYSSNKVKISLFNRYQINIEREIDISDFIISNIKIIKNNIILLINSKQSAKSKLLCFNDSLVLKWEKDISEGIYGNLLITTDSNLEKFFYINKDKLICEDIHTGKTNWSYSINKNNYKAYEISLPIINNNHIILNNGDYLRTKDIYINNVLTIINIDTGVLVSTKNIENTEKAVKLLESVNSFFTITPQKITKYQFKK